MEYMGIDGTDIFKLMDVLSINDAAALIAGASPADVNYDEQYDSYYLRSHARHYSESVDTAFTIARKSLINAITSSRLKANIFPITNSQKLFKSDLTKDWIAMNGISSEDTVIDRDDLKLWLENRGVYAPMLFPNNKKDDHMNSGHPHYAPKLALCVKAWEIAQTANLNGKTYKKFMNDWMIENAKLYGVENTNPKEFDKLASISNWATKGGRTKSEPTLPLMNNFESNNKDPTVHHELLINLPNEPVNYPTDDDIPF